MDLLRDEITLYFADNAIHLSEEPALIRSLAGVFLDYIPRGKTFSDTGYDLAWGVRSKDRARAPHGQACTDLNLVCYNSITEYGVWTDVPYRDTVFGSFSGCLVGTENWS